jgi:hypothetical protein
VVGFTLERASTALTGMWMNSNILGHEDTKHTKKNQFFSSSCFRVFVANDAADYPDVDESSESRTSPGLLRVLD